MKRATVLLWLFMAYLFIACDARSEYVEVDEGAIYSFCADVDFVNARYCFYYVKECVLDEGVKEMQFCQNDYKSDMVWRESN